MFLKIYKSYIKYHEIIKMISLEIINFSVLKWHKIYFYLTILSEGIAEKVIEDATI